MARLTAHTATDMRDNGPFFGTLIDATETMIEVGSGDWTNRYSGAFSYPAPGAVSGTVTGLERHNDGALAIEISGFQTDAYGVARALESGNIDLFYTMVLFGDDVIRGSDDTDILLAHAGNDRLSGRGGDDALYGDEGADLLRGGTGSDLLLGGTGTDRIGGGRGGDALAGGDGDDRLHGGAGQDRLDGEAGNDRLSGGAGADTFYFLAGGGRDRITDFAPDEGDRLTLDAGLDLGGLSLEGIVQEFGHVTAAGHTVLSFDDGARLTLRHFDDLGTLAEALDLF